ncbi:plant synaptotagmin [Selaginella moellendorffii]|uniref:Plant synaptotagmin n=1 Tax=Selaginella moellendorffii TaxID=88036 RepID=D8RWJ6_SELML|nr:synaptotagmin-5 [Selaginella moellendorffii]EFJ23674.1 plant synaptotagmin [Selaginella moellendorffii]|eukprot:XP_002975473.1 synaptotagmin-5 [Selaginella moellendorffii]
MGLVIGFVLGLLLGLALTIAFVLCENQRSQARRKLAVSTAAFSQLSVEDVRKLFSKQSLPQWVLFTQYDKVSWLNYELRKMWPFIDQATSELTRVIVEPILEQYKPPVISSLKFQKFTLGTVAPQFVGIQKVETTDDEIVLEMELQWDGNPSIILGVKTMLGVSLPPVQVKDIGVTGVFRVVLKPLVDTFPCFGAIMYSLREQKKLDFKLKFIGGDIKAFPVLAGAIDGMIRTAVTDSFLWPMRQVVPILAGDYSDLQLRTCGRLVVKVVQAKDLLNMDLFGKSDPFAQLFIRPIPARRKRTKTIDNDLNPVWNEVFEFEIEDPATQKLFVHIFDEDSVQASELIGSTQVPVRELQPGSLTEYWLPLVKDLGNKKENKYRGQVQLELLYMPLDVDSRPEGGTKSQTPRTPLVNGVQHHRRASSLASKLSSKSFIKPAAVHYRVLSSGDDQLAASGTLGVTVIRGENLVAKDFNGKSDPYVVIYMKGSKAKMQKTSVMRKTLNPEWNQRFQFPVEDARNDMVVVEVWDRDVFGKDFMGSCALTLSKVLTERSYYEVVTLSPRAAGKLHLHLEWTNA